MVRFTDKGDGIIGIGVWPRVLTYIGPVNYLEYEDDSVCIKGMFRGSDHVNTINLPIGCFCSIVVGEGIDKYHDDWASLFITGARILKVDNGEATFISHEELKVNGRDRLFSFAHQDGEDFHEGMIKPSNRRMELVLINKEYSSVDFEIMLHTCLGPQYASSVEHNGRHGKLEFIFPPAIGHGSRFRILVRDRQLKVCLADIDATVDSVNGDYMYFDIMSLHDCQPAEPAKKQEDPHTGMIQNPITGKWSWF